jgi:hypothetical protein
VTGGTFINRVMTTDTFSETFGRVGKAAAAEFVKEMKVIP